MNCLKFCLLMMLAAYAPITWSQCAPGIPGAGNPGCIPPTAPGSPYGQPGEAATPTQPAAVWEDRWGAIALDYGNGASGAIDNGTSKQNASRGALEQCAQRGGAHCDVAIAFVNQCAAIAQKPGGGVVSSGTAAEARDAESRALARCGDGTCKLLGTVCTYAVRTQ